MIKSKNLLIMLGVIVLLVAATVLVFMMPSADENAVNTSATATPTVPIFSCDAEDITEIAIIAPDDQYTLVRQDGWTVKEKPAIILDMSAVDSLARQMSSLNAKSVINQPEALSVYGLAEPQATCTLILADGSKKTLLLGNEDSVNRIFYLKAADAEEIYTISSGLGAVVLRSIKEYRDKTLLTVDTNALSRVVVERQSDTIEVAKRDDEWMLIKPLEQPTDSQRLYEQILTPISEMAISEFVYESTDKDSTYGLTTPTATIRLYDESGASQTIYVGAQSGTDYYVRTDRSDSIYLVPGASLIMLSTDAFTLTNRFIHLISVEEVDQVEVMTADETFTLQVIRIPTGEEGKNNVVYRLNGSDVIEETFERDIYQQVIGLTGDGFSVNPQRGESYVDIVFHMSDGTKKSFSYGPYDERNYAAFDEDGNSMFYVRQKKVEDMLTALRTAAG